MAEILFVLVTVFTVYVVHSAFSKNKEKNAKPVDQKSEKPKAEKPQGKEEKNKPIAKPKPKAKKPVQKKPTPTKKVTPVKKATPAKKVTSAKKAAAMPEGSMRNPETGEIDKIASHYRMLKRWMKDALVEEKLLDKVYKSNELDDAIKKKIEKALTKLAKMDKYQ